jgi:hypothetical protein
MTIPSALAMPRNLRRRLPAIATHAGRLFLATLLGLLPAVALGGAVASCNSLRGGAGAAAGAFIDCEAPAIADALPDLLPFARAEIERVIDPSTGNVDTTKLLTDLRGVTSNLGRCAIAAAFAAISPTPGAASLTTSHNADISASFSVVRTELHWPDLHVSGRVL